MAAQGTLPTLLGSCACREVLLPQELYGKGPEKTMYPELYGKEPPPAEKYFSETYVEAREKFHCAARALSSSVSVRIVMLLVKEPDYTIDIVIVNGTGGSGLCVHSSGVHGVEGYAGSAIQTAMLHGMHCSGDLPKVRCMFIHAINPHGMAHFRRWNENNVDLNRNALTAEGWAEVKSRPANIAGYEDFKGLLTAESAPSWCFVHIGLWIHSLYLSARYGQRHLKRATVTATYQHPQGIFYGGDTLQPSHVLLSKFLRDNFGDVPGGEVTWIDVHTGLGPKGVDVLLCAGTDKDTITTQFSNVDVQCSGDTSLSDDSQAAGYELVRGSVVSFYGTMFDETKGRALIATQEFGTLPPEMMARNMVIENRGYHFDYANHEHWRNYTRDAFYCREPVWKASVLSRGKTVFHELLSLSLERSTLSYQSSCQSL